MERRRILPTLASSPTLVSVIRDLPYLMSVLRDWVATYKGDELFYEAQRRHQPFGAVWSVAEALEKSPQIPARGYLQPRKVPGFGSVLFPGHFFRTNADGARCGLARQVDMSAIDWPSRSKTTVPPKAARGKLPLEGVRILDFTHVLAGPFGTRILGDLGADVIKVGTASRGGGANTPDHPYFVMWNRNKRNISINMAAARGREIARKLAETWTSSPRTSAQASSRVGGWIARRSRRAIPGSASFPWAAWVRTGRGRTSSRCAHDSCADGADVHDQPSGRHDLGYGFSLTDHLSGLAGALRRSKPSSIATARARASTSIFHNTSSASG